MYMIKDLQETQYEGIINCELDHPEHGWIPFTIDPNDTMPYGRSIYQLAQALVASGELSVKPYDWEAHWKEQFEITRSKLLDSASLSNQEYDELEEEQRESVTAYRKALKSPTHEEGEGEFTDWPEKPDFLD